MTWRMPAETAPQDRVWMAFPASGYTLGDDAGSAAEARQAWADVAHAVLEFEPVTMVVDPAEAAVARRYLSGAVEIIEAPLDDAWMRDIGPSFVLGKDDPGAGELGAGKPGAGEPRAVELGAVELGAVELGAVDWTFNGWGGQDWARWGKDAEIGRLVTGASGATGIPSLLVNEGGGIQVDGLGTVLATLSVQLDPGRNPHADRASVEAELARTIGATHVVWLPRGLTRDQERYGTRGHVDIVAAIPSPGTLLVHSQDDPGHPDYLVTRELRRMLAESTDAAGSPWTIIDLPAPAALSDSEGFVDYSYVNHLVVNGGVIACSFGEERADEAAREILAAAYPGRSVVAVEARPLFARGGGIHCITQQQPSVPA